MCGWFIFDAGVICVLWAGDHGKEQTGPCRRDPAGTERSHSPAGGKLLDACVWW